MFLLNNTQVQEDSELFTGNYSAMGGLHGTPPPTSSPFFVANTSSIYDGSDGTVWTSLAPCGEGYGTVFCTVCPAGTYKNGTDVSPCVACTNGPEHSVYTNRGQGNSQCPFTCLTGYRGQDCLTPFAEFLRQIGGWMVVGVILALFLITISVCTLLILQYNRILFIRCLILRNACTPIPTTRTVSSISMVCSRYRSCSSEAEVKFALSHHCYSIRTCRKNLSEWAKYFPKPMGCSCTSS